ncbi:unnamed protein product [Rhodiola kirilowii]
MAFFSKVGNILRQTSGKQMTADLSRVNSSIFQVIRCMSSSKVFIGGISYSTDDQSLKEAFARYGEVLEARIIMDRETGRSRGFGFVTYTSSEEASSAIQALDGQELHGRRVKVNYANDRPRPSYGGDGYGGEGGYGGGGGYGVGGGYGGGGGGYGGGGGGYGGGGYGGGGPAYDNNSGGGGGGYAGGGGAPYESTGGAGGGYGGGQTGYAAGGGYGGGQTGYVAGSGGYGQPANENYNSSSSYAPPPIYGGGNPNFSGEGGYGGPTETGSGSGVDQFANNPSSSAFADGSGDINSTQGELQNADDDEFGKAGESRN